MFEHGFRQSRNQTLRAQTDKYRWVFGQSVLLNLD